MHGEEVEADYRPNLFVTYWSFRLMMGLAAFSGVLAFWALWVTRGKGENARTTGSKAFQWFAVLAIPMPFLANSAGWVFTEIGRQPWVVHPNPDDPTVRLMTLQGVSAHPSWMVLASLVAFTLVYGVLAVIWFRMMQKAALKGAPPPRGTRRPRSSTRPPSPSTTEKGPTCSWTPCSTPRSCRPSGSR
ncbi:cytochrome ubiquinol oxidase subunit I [Brachybacterium sp. GPGPB12]|uniref:cytochrome ubiquinol oxidase subunit I n=1 Tax=Brachybacterium sp. GPGPB12 TaxID=3023517 RepID=UPI0031344142